MYVRLAFAVAAHLDTDILLVDEVLAVGDADFQKRSLGKMNVVTRGGRTVIVVSHQTDTVKALCDRVIMMERGAVFADGPAAEVVSTYRGRLVGSADAASGARAPVGRGGYLITSLTVPELVDSGAAITASYEVVRQREGAGRFFVSMSIFDSADLLIAHCDSRVFESMFPERPSSHGQIRVYDLLLRPGEYKVDFYVGSPDVDDHWVNAARFTVTGMPFQGQVFDHRHLDKGVVLTRFEVKLGE
jgi:lipopolysaccharide transport system ATP-binding protein